MALTEDQIKEIESIGEKIDSVAQLLSEWRVFSESPYAGMYLSILKQITDWNTQTAEQSIDLFAGKDIKDFERVSKYFSDTQMYTERLDFLRSKMKPEEIKKANEDAKDPYERALVIDGSITS